jgi:hypothetical protein
MTSLNLSKNTPLTDISLYYKYVDQNTLKDPKFIELMDLISTKNYHSYKYSMYTDSFLLRANIYLPNFHSSYLACGKHNVFIEDENDVWLTEIFPQNNYYIMPKDNDTFNYESRNIKSIKSIKEIL